MKGKEEQLVDFYGKSDKTFKNPPVTKHPEKENKISSWRDIPENKKRIVVRCYCRMEIWKNWSPEYQQLFRIWSHLEYEKQEKNIKYTVEYLRKGDNYNEKRINEYIKTVNSAVALISRGRKGGGQGHIGTDFYMEDGKTKIYFPNPRKTKKKKVVKGNATNED